MLTLSRRLLVILTLLFWQGGFLFYAAVVVPISTEVLGSAKRQGFITRQVTNGLNLAGVIALVPLTADLLMAPERSRWRWRLRWLLCLGLWGTLAALVWLHPRMDELLDTRSGLVLDSSSFRLQHRLYLWLSTFQWAFSMVLVWLMLWAWREADRNDR